MVKICEHNEYTVGKDRCRRHAKFAVVHKVPFGKRVNMHGPDVPVYRPAVAFRCPDHVEGIAHEERRLTMDQYAALAVVAGLEDNEEAQA